MISKKQQEYIDEYEKYKHIEIPVGIYELRSATHIKYEVVKIENETVTLRTIKTDNVLTKTLHWCRKNLVKVHPF